MSLRGSPKQVSVVWYVKSVGFWATVVLSIRICLVGLITSLERDWHGQRSVAWKNEATIAELIFHKKWS